jgi:CubicO group peptidase (beta-lactamase class C family)
MSSTDDVLPSSTPQAIGLSPPALARLSQVLRGEIERKRLPGAVALIARRGRIGYLEAHGVQAPGSDAPMRTDSIFRIYSMTKAITSVGIMMLVENGRLLLSDPLSKHLPEFAQMQVGVEHDGKLALAPAARPIMIHDLLRHTSGLSYDFVATGELARLYKEAGLDGGGLNNPSLTTQEVCRKLAGLPLLHHPGTHWSYSHSTDVLGRVIEVVAGTSLEDYLTRSVLAPLGMIDTAFQVPAAKQGRIAQPFATDPEAGTPVKLTDVRRAPPWQAGGGGLVSTAHDYARFCAMLAGGGALGGVRLLARKTVEFMASDHLGPGVAIDTALGLLPPGHGFGLGFAVRTHTGIASFPGTAGTFYWGGIAGTTYWLDPKEELFALLLIQAPGQREYYRMLFRNLVYATLE